MSVCVEVNKMFVLSACVDRNLEGNKGALGVLNWLGEKFLLLAHLQRSNTREGGWGPGRQGVSTEDAGMAVAING